MLSKSVRDALAVKHLMGEFPKHIQMPTWSAAYRCCDQHNGRTVLPEYVADVERAPRVIAARYLERQGFRAPPYPERIGGRDSLKMIHDDGREGYVTRSGDGWIWTRNEHRPYLTTEHFKFADAATRTLSEVAGDKSWSF